MLLRIIKYLAVSVVTIVTLSFALLSNGSFQSYLGSRVAAYMSEISGMKIEIKNINIGRLLTIDINGLLVEDHHSVAMFDIGKLRIAGINYKILNGSIGIGMVRISNGDVNLVQYLGEEELNINMLINKFDSGDTTSSGFKMPKIEVANIELERMKFRYQDENISSETRAMDYANIRVNDIFLELHNVTIDGLKFDFEMVNLSATERCGLIINSMSGNFKLSDKYLDVKDLLLQTPYSKLDCDFDFACDRWRDWVKFITNMNMRVNIRESQVNTLDIGRFAEGIYGFNNEVGIKATGEGTVDNICVDIENLRYGDNTLFNGSVSINGLPNIENSIFGINAHRFDFTLDDFLHVNIGGGRRLDYMFQLPKELVDMGKLEFIGKFDGSMDDFNTAFSLAGEKLGSVNIDGQMIKEVDGDMAYNIGAVAKDLRLGTLTNVKELGNGSFSLKLKGRGLDVKKLNVDGDINIDYLQLLGYSYKNITLSGGYYDKSCNAKVVANDDNLKFEIEGFADLKEDNILTEFDLKLKHAVLNKLGLIPSSSDTTNISLQTNVRVRFSGTDIDNNISLINIDSTLFKDGDKSIFMKRLSLTTQMGEEFYKSIRLQSDYINLDLTGAISFVELPAVIEDIIDNTLLMKASDSVVKEYQKTQDFNFIANLKNLQPLLDFLDPQITINSSILVEGGLRSEDESMFAFCNIPKMSYSGVDIISTKISLSTQSKDRLSLKLISDSVNIGGYTNNPIALTKWDINALASSDTVDYKVAWVSNDTTNFLKGVVSVQEPPKTAIKITDSYVSGTDRGIWKFSPSSTLSIISSTMGTEISLEDFDISNGTESIGVEGSLSHADTSRLRLTVNNFAISNLDFVLTGVSSGFRGDISGYFEIINPYGIPRFESNLKIAHSAFREEELGDISVMIDYDRDNELIEIAVNSVVNSGGYKYSPISVNGFYYPTKSSVNKNQKAGTFDISCKVQNFNVAIAEVFLSNFLSDMKGNATGFFNIKGTFDEPDMNGNIKLQNTQFRVNYLNTLYSLSDEFKVDNDGMMFDNVRISDTLGRVALLNGEITHKNLKDFYLDLTLTPENFAILYTNRTASSIFYGSASVSGNVKVIGPVDNIVVSAKVRTTKGSDIYIPISSTSTIEDSYFIVFVDNSGKEASDTAPQNAEPKDTGVTLNFGINVNTDTQISVLIPGGVGNLAVKGNGNVNMEIDKHSNFALFGDYIVNSGTFTLNLENIYGKQLDINSGSRIAFRGDPANASIDIGTYYKTRANLSGLNLADTTYNNVRTDVKAMIYLKNSLMNPEMRFSIEFPGISNDIAQLIYSTLDTNNQVMMTQQVLSLMLLNTFSLSSTSSNLGSSITESSIELLTSQLNKVLSSFSKNVDIGFNYRPEDKTNSIGAEYEVAVSTNFLDNRLQVSGNFGVREGVNVSSTNPSQFIGDVLVSYKLTKEGNIRVVGYNQTNNTTINPDVGEYTQGVGIALSKSFNNIKQLFTKSKQEKEKAMNRKAKREAKQELKKEAIKEDEETL